MPRAKEMPNNDKVMATRISKVIDGRDGAVAPGAQPWRSQAPAAAPERRLHLSDPRPGLGKAQPLYPDGDISGWRRGRATTGQQVRK